MVRRKDRSHSLSLILAFRGEKKYERSGRFMASKGEMRRRTANDPLYRMENRYYY
jgi:hypothetical protein